jgi:hypothetical protein
VTTEPRRIATAVRNVLDFMWNAELLIALSQVSESPTAVAWHALEKGAGLLEGHEHANVEQYLSWLRTGHYSCILIDGSILQMSYNLEEGRVIKHRLAYIPCPWKWDSSLLDEGFSLEEALEIHADEHTLMRSSVRFDLDLRAAKKGHPASHLTFNSTDCRIACTAPVHPHRFAGFVFKHFYALHWQQHRSFFDSAPYRHLGDPVIADDDRNDIHLNWNPHLQVSA